MLSAMWTQELFEELERELDRQAWERFYCHLLERGMSPGAAEELCDLITLEMDKNED